MKRPLSMTAFGRGASTAGERTWIAEIRSVNHRYSDIKIKIPRKYLGLEDRIKRKVAGQYARGHVDVFLTMTGDITETMRLKANLTLAREYYQCLDAIKTELSLATTPTLELVASFKDVIAAEDLEEDLETVWQPIKKALDGALGDCLHMRQAEGQALKEDLSGRLEIFSKAVSKISESVPTLVMQRETALKERLDNLLKGVDIDPVRLAQEVAIMADKSDVTEELVRLQSHIQQFSHFLDLDEPVGRRLDFLLQEFLREINTLASKISNIDIAHTAVELKNEVEKMREQIQNIE